MPKPNGQAAQPLEFLYEHFRGEEEIVSIPHRVVKRTAKRVYVDRAWYHPDDEEQRLARLARGEAEWEDLDVEMVVVDRAALEQTGHARCTGLGDWRDGYLYVKPYHQTSHSSGVPECLTVLGLTLPCTAEDVRRAFRVQAQALHPDKGGDASRFIALKQAYDEALALVSPTVGR